MTTPDQITLWRQRRFRGKLHIPGSVLGKPKCDRQLNNHRDTRTQVADRPEFAQSLEEFTYWLLEGRACRHCAYRSGLLVRTRTITQTEDDEDE